MEYDHIIIADDLDINKLGGDDARKVVSYIRIDDSRIVGNVIFNDTVFNNISFKNTSFFRPVSFRDSKFKGYVDFRDSKFNGPVDFSGASFADASNFDKSQFNSYANFMNSHFRDDATFIESAFNGVAQFIGANFTGAGNFDRSSFNKYTCFMRSKFNGDAVFRDSKFNMNVDFMESQFKGDSQFNNAKPNGTVCFNKATFSGYVWGWNEIKNSLSASDEATFLGFIKNFKDHGQFDEADDCYFTYRYYDMGRSSDLLGWINDHLSLITCGFGVRWQYTIIFGTICILIFGIIYLMIMIKQNGFDKEVIVKQLLDSLWFSTMVLLSVPSELYPNKSSTYKDYTKKIKYHLPILERLIGCGIVILFINTLSRVMLHL